MKKYIKAETANQIEYKGYIIQWSQWAGIYYIIKNGKVVGHAPNDKEAMEWVDGTPIKAAYYSTYSDEPDEPDYETSEGVDEITISFREPVDLNDSGWYTFRNFRLDGTDKDRPIYSDDGIVILTDTGRALDEIITLLETDEYYPQFDILAGPYLLSGTAHLVYNTKRHSSSQLYRERAEYDPSGNFIGYLDEVGYDYLDSDFDDVEFIPKDSWIEDFKITPLE